MAHDVFICHSTSDKTTADAACVHMEAAGIRCWIAPRDPIPGVPYSRQLVDAIDAARIFLLIFSKNTARSEHVMRELELAADRNKIIIPFRIDATEPTADLEYYIRRVHWLDAITPPMGKRLDELVVLIQRVLSISAGETESAGASPQSASASPQSVAPLPTPLARPLPTRTIAIGGGAALLLVLIVVIAVLASRHRAPPRVALGPSPRASASAAASDWWRPYNRLPTFYARGVACVSKPNGTSVQTFRLYNGRDERMFYDVGARQVYPEGYGEIAWMQRNGRYRFALEPNQQSGPFTARFGGRCATRFQVLLYEVRYGVDRGRYVRLS